MRTLVACLAVLTLGIPAIAHAQSEGANVRLAPELAKFETSIGNWEGSGSVKMPGMPAPMPWTSKTTVKPVLANQFIQSEMKVEFGPEMPAMVFRSFYGWDPGLKKLVSYSIGNTGELEVSDTVSWIDDSTLVVLATTTEAGVPTVNRSITTFDGDQQSFLWQGATGAKAFETIVEGTSKKCKQGYEISAQEWSAAFMPGTPESPAMKKLSGMAGDYSMTGEFSMMPGMEPMKISGRESIQSIFGGAAIQMHMLGDPSVGPEGVFTYEGLSYLIWDPTLECYREFYLNNMGETSIQELRFVGEAQLVTTQARVQAGQPEATRGTMHLDETGAIRKVSMDRMSAGHKPERAFLGEYKKATIEN